MIDPGWSARVVARRPLRYRRGADPAIDRPAHVRAASALAWLGPDLVVIQDDALFVGVVDPATGLVDDVAVPGLAVRTFDAGRGNKLAKPDLEAAIAVDGELVAFGSGGPYPERQVVLRWRRGGAPVLVAAPALFAALAAVAAPEGALNLEGAAAIGGRVWFANRGGDRGRGGAVTRDRLVAAGLADVLAAIAAGTAPAGPLAVVEVALGAVAGVDLHLSELAVAGDRLWCLAVAERTTAFDADGAVVGSAIGVLDGAGGARLARIVDAAGAAVTDKLEGLALGREAGRAYAVTDPDDPDRPGELLELAL